MKKPWYQTVSRWMQANLTETDPERCEISFWEKQWQENRIQGIIVNAGGIVAYYPSENPLQYRAKTLGGRDLLGEFTEAAHRLGIAVLARMDVSRADKAVYSAHPDWFAIDREGAPYRTNDGRYFACVNGGYYAEQIPAVLREIAEKYRPEGFADNSWAGLPKDKICYCENCRRRFRSYCGKELPDAPSFDDPIYREWILWSLTLRTEVWDRFNKAAADAGGEDCLWLGMMNCNPSAPYFCDLDAISARSKIVLSDYQARDQESGFEQNGLYGSVLSSLTGYDKLHPESAANYVRGRRVFRLSANPAAETRLWLAEGMMGNLSPWLHFISGAPEDRRAFGNCPSLLRWHAENESLLQNREPIADIALLWSQKNTLFYGRNNAFRRAELPWRGISRAMLQGRIPFEPLHITGLKDRLEQFCTVILPDIAVISEQEEQALTAFVKGGGNLVFSGASGFLDGTGALRQKPALDALLGIVRCGPILPLPSQGDWMDESRHSYLRLPAGRSPLLLGFAETDILPFGGILYPVKAENYQAAAAFIPPFPIYPPELSAMDVRETAAPVILYGETGYGGRMVYFAGDIDRLAGEVRNPDHLALLVNAVAYAHGESFPYTVSGPGTLDTRLYKQGDRLIFQLINLSGANQLPGYCTEILPVSGVSVSIRTGGRTISAVTSKVTGQEIPFTQRGDSVSFTLPSVELQEMLVLN